VWAATLLSILCLSGLPGHRSAAVATSRYMSSATVATKRALAIGDAYGKLPLRFEENRGQADGNARFLARGPGYTLSFGPRAVTLALVSAARPRKQGAETKAHTDDSGGTRRVASPVGGASGPATTPMRAAVTESIVQLQFAGANAHPHMAGLDRLPGAASYFVGTDRHRWRAGVPTYARVAYRDIYPGIDLVYYGSQGQLEYDWTLRPAARPTTIRLAVATPDGQPGAGRLQVDRTGDLVLRLPDGDLRQRRPRAYQWIAGRKVAVSARYVRLGPDEVGVRVGRYDAHKELVIDPTLVYSTHLGGSDTDGGAGIAVDAAGAAYVVGWTSSLEFPTTPNAYQGHTNGRDYTPCPCAATNIFVSKLSADGGSLVYSTYLGSSGPDVGQAIAVDAAGNAYITGYTMSTAFPTTPGAYIPRDPGGNDNAFVAALNARGDGLRYSTYLGGGDDTFGRGIAVDAGGAAYATGSTAASNYPTTPGAAATAGGGYVTKLTPDGGVSYSTFIGGAGAGVAVDGAGAAYVTGGGFTTKLSADGHSIVYSTGIGGAGAGIAVVGGDAYVAGYTESPGIATSGAYDRYYAGHGDAFATKLDAGGRIAYATYLGGSDYDGGTGVAVNATGDAYVTGFTRSADFPTDDRPFGGGMCYGGDLDQGRDVPCPDAFVTELDPLGQSLLYSTFLGGGDEDEGQAIALDASGDVYVTGTTISGDFPLQHALYGPSACDGHTVWSCEDAFVAKLSVSGTTPVSPSPTSTDSPSPTSTDSPSPTPTESPTSIPSGTATTTTIPSATATPSSTSLPRLTATGTATQADATGTAAAPVVPPATPTTTGAAVVPSSATPLPLSQPTTGPMTGPGATASPPTSTATARSANTAIPVIGATAVGGGWSTPRATPAVTATATRAASRKRRGTPPGPPLDARPLRALVGGDTVALSIRTAPYVTVEATLSVTGRAHTQSTARGVLAPRTHRPSPGDRTVTTTVTLYRTMARGRADRHGWITLRLHVAFTPARPTTATLALVARSGRYTSTRHLRVTITPPRHQTSHGRMHRRYATT